MKWTTEKPVKQGWYWWQLYLEAESWEVLYVHPDYDRVGPWGDGSYSMLSQMDGLWAGPLEPPEGAL